MSLHYKVLLGLALVVVCGSFWGYTWIEDNIRPQYLRIMEDSMVDQAFLLARQVERQLPDDNPTRQMSKLPLARIMATLPQTPIQARIYEWQKKRVDFRVYLTDAKGIVRYDSDHGLAVGQDYSRWNDVYLALRGKYGARSSRGLDSQGRPYNALFVAFPLRKNGEIVGTLTLAKSKASLSGWAKRAQARLWWGVLVFSSVLFLLAWLVTQLLLRPVFRWTQYARDVASGRRVQPPPLSNDEIGTLAREFVAMKTTLWQRRDIEQDVAQLTHELKSPISAIRGAAELLEESDMPEAPRRRFLTNIQEQAQRLDTIVQRLLALVALEQREELREVSPVSVEAMVRGLRERFLLQAERKAIALQVACDPSAPERVMGDVFLLEQALANLLQNSVHFTPEGGAIRLSVRSESMTLADRSRQTVVIFDVRDSGAGIPGFALERVMEKFYSLEHPDTGQKGTGLGLPFVKQVALLHGGDFSLTNRTDAPGAHASLWIPVGAAE